MALFTYFLAGNKTRITMQAAAPSGKGSLETGYSVGKWRNQCDGDRTGGGGGGEGSALGRVLCSVGSIVRKF